MISYLVSKALSHLTSTRKDFPQLFLGGHSSVTYGSSSVHGVGDYLIATKNNQYLQWGMALDSAPKADGPRSLSLISR